MNLQKYRDIVVNVARGDVHFSQWQTKCLRVPAHYYPQNFSIMLFFFSFLLALTLEYLRVMGTSIFLISSLKKNQAGEFQVSSG